MIPLTPGKLAYLKKVVDVTKKGDARSELRLQNILKGLMSGNSTQLAQPQKDSVNLASSVIQKKELQHEQEDMTLQQPGVTQSLPSQSNPLRPEPVKNVQNEKLISKAHSEVKSNLRTMNSYQILSNRIQLLQRQQPITLQKPGVNKCHQGPNPSKQSVQQEIGIASAVSQQISNKQVTAIQGGGAEEERSKQSIQGTDQVKNRYISSQIPDSSSLIKTPQDMIKNSGQETIAKAVSMDIQENERNEEIRDMVVKVYGHKDGRIDYETFFNAMGVNVNRSNLCDPNITHIITEQLNLQPDKYTFGALVSGKKIIYVTYAYDCMIKDEILPNISEYDYFVKCGHWPTVKLSKQLEEIVGTSETYLDEVGKLMCVYIKENKLQDPKNKKYIICDEKLQNIVGQRRIKYSAIGERIFHHTSLYEKFLVDEKANSGF